LKESTILLVFVAVSPLIPFLLLGLALLKPIVAYAPRVALEFVATPEGGEGVFMMDISSYARSQLVQGLFAGFMSGVMFAVAFVKWLDEKRPRLTMGPVQPQTSS